MWTQRRVIDGLTVVAVAAWVGTLLVRVLMPQTVAAWSGVDAVVLMVFTFWFASASMRRGDGS